MSPHPQSGTPRDDLPGPAGALLTALVVVGALGACSPEDRHTDAADSVRVGAPALPDTLRDTLVLEGNPEPVELWLFRTPPGFPLPFHSYVPADMTATASESARGAAVRFVARFGGQPRDNMYLEMRVPRRELSGPEASRLAREVAGGLGEPRPRSGPGGGDGDGWTLERHDYRAGDEIGSVVLGRRGRRHFLLVTRYPAEAADGMGPRIALILRHWRWADTEGGSRR